MPMERIGLAIPPELLGWLRAEAERRGVSMGVLVRNLIRAERDKVAREGRDDERRE
jgi:hypothetical protein